MKHGLLLLLLSLGNGIFLSPSASAGVASFAATNQSITWTSLGGNAAGQGQSRVTWGSCVFADGITTCTVTAAYTGIGNGGTLTAVLAYAGNGLSPLTVTSITPGNDLVSASLSSGSFLITLTPTNGEAATFYQPSISLFFNTPTCTLSPTCSVGQVGLTAGATISGKMNGTFDATPVIRNSQGVISASAFGGFSALAPGSWMEIYGTNLATVISREWSGSDFNGNLAPSTLVGTTVKIGGLTAFIDYVSPGQVNAQVPSGVPSGPQPVVVTTAGGASLAYTITVKAVEPGLLAPAVFNLPAGQYVAALFPDAVTFVLPPISGAPTARAKPGDTITFYGVGFGPVTPDSPAGRIVTGENHLQATFRASFGGVSATVTFAGLAGGFLGLYQFNVVVPNVAASDSVAFTYSLDGVSGPQSLVIAIRN
ncbi:MAG: hypothetical protein ABI811_07645 [Acidobacteriota bacterium]